MDCGPSRAGSFARFVLPRDSTVRVLAGQPQGIDPALPALEVLELCRRADVVRGELDQLVGGQVAAAGVADQHIDPAVPSLPQPRQDASGEAGVVPAVACLLYT